MSDYTDIQPELDDFENAVYGEEVRGSMISAIKKIYDIAESAASSSGSGLTTAQKSTLMAVINAIGAFNVPNGQALINAFNSAWQETQPIPATGITLNRNTLSFNSAQTVILSATVTPSNTTDTVTWSTSNANVAMVNGGAVVPVSNGSCTITARAGSVSATCAVTVNIESGEITFSQSGSTLVVSGAPSISSITQSGSTLALS